MKRLAYFVEDCAVVIIIVLFLVSLIVVIPVSYIRKCIMSNLKLRRKCRKMWRATKATWAKMITLISNNKKGEIAEKIAKPAKETWGNFIALFSNIQKGEQSQRRYKKGLPKTKQESPKANKESNSTQTEIFSGEAKIVKRVYKPAYTEVTFFTRKEIAHKEEHYIYIEYEGRRYKLKGKELFMKFEAADTIKINGERRISKDSKTHTYINHVDYAECVAA